MEYKKICSSNTYLNETDNLMLSNNCFFFFFCTVLYLYKISMYRMLTQAQGNWVDKTGLLATNFDCYYYHLECF